MTLWLWLWLNGVMPLHRCSLCGDPAAVSTRDAWLCRHCYRTIERDAMHDNALPNAPTCAGCGQPEHGDHACLHRGVLETSGL